MLEKLAGIFTWICLCGFGVGFIFMTCALIAETFLTDERYDAAHLKKYGQERPLDVRGRRMLICAIISTLLSSYVIFEVGVDMCKNDPNLYSEDGLPHRREYSPNHKRLIWPKE